MGSSFFGGPNMARPSSSSSSSSSSSRKGKKSSSEKPKQPQRGLGVAQLEKMRLHDEMSCNSFQYPSIHSPYPTTFNQEDMMMQRSGCSSMPSSSPFPSYSSSASYGFHPSMTMSLSEYEISNMRHGDPQPTTIASRYGISESQHIAQPSIATHSLNLDVEDSKLRSRSRNSESSDTQELDLELRLSL